LSLGDVDQTKAHGFDNAIIEEQLDKLWLNPLTFMV
jgi:hypothetical protein